MYPLIIWRCHLSVLMLVWTYLKQLWLVIILQIVNYKLQLVFLCKKTWNLSTFTGLLVKTMVKRLWALEWQEPLRLEQLKMTKIMFTMKGEVIIVSQSEEKYSMWKFKKTRLPFGHHFYLMSLYWGIKKCSFFMKLCKGYDMTCHWVSVFLVYSNERMKHSV